MPDIRQPLVFVSYRRQDSSAAARWLAQTIARTFGSQSVFIDTEAIRTGDDWAEQIDQALESASILIPVIGPSWLRIADEYGRRRLDLDDDWVRNEILHALEHKLRVIPLLLSGTPLPKKEALPPGIARLTAHQAFELRDDRWEPDLMLLLSRLEELGLQRFPVPAIRYPTPRVTLKELSPAEMDSALARLPGWQIVVSDMPGKEPRKRSELFRVFEFASFEDAIAFMSAAASEIARIDHHPRWENIWRSVSVWLTTWDIGHEPSVLDTELAEFLSTLREKYAPAQSQRAESRDPDD
jgi:pterin-4a-carbinolamine dehydratase